MFEVTKVPTQHNFINVTKAGAPTTHEGPGQNDEDVPEVVRVAHEAPPPGHQQPGPRGRREALKTCRGKGGEGGGAGLDLYYMAYEVDYGHRHKGKCFSYN